MSVAVNLSFSKAAVQFNISQPAVSRHIKELEERYKTNLFKRKGNKVYLTKAAEKVYNAYKEIAQLYRNLDFEIGHLHRNVYQEKNNAVNFPILVIHNKEMVGVKATDKQMEVRITNTEGKQVKTFNYKMQNSQTP